MSGLLKATMKQLTAASLAATATCLLVLMASYPVEVHAQGVKKAPSKSSSKKKRPRTKKLSRKQAITFLRQGYDSLKAKQYKQAITELSTAMSSGRLRQRELAQAHYYRGVANRVAKRPADAISDLARALLFEGALSQKERTDALAQRKQAYADAGITGTSILAPSTTVAAVPVTPSSKKPAKRAGTKKTAKAPAANWSASTKTASTKKSSPSGFTSFFGNLFGGSSVADTPKTGSAPPPAAPASKASWSSATRITTASVDRKTAKKKPRRQSVARAAPAKPGRYQLQVAPSQKLKTVSVAAKKVAARHASLLRGRKPVVAQKIVPGIGKLHYVQIKSFGSKGDAIKVCDKLLASGFDCLVTK